MPSDLQQTILTAFTQVAGSVVNNPATGVGDSLLPAREDILASALSQATQVVNAQTAATSANTDALGRDTQTRGTSGAGDAAVRVMNTASDLLGGGLSLLPLVSLFSSLWDGGESNQPGPLAPYSFPPALHLETTNQYQNVVWGENGLPRSGGSNAGAAPQITVQVQAMDSRSFLEHSHEIAQAVRQAMLNMNSLNDVVTNL